MYNRSASNSIPILESIISLCIDLKANVVAGPINSGAVIASAVGALVSRSTNYELCSLFIEKEGYVRQKHVSDNLFLFGLHIPACARVVLVDDVIDSGATIQFATQMLMSRRPNLNIVGVVATNGFYDTGLNLIREMFPSVPCYLWDDFAENMVEK